MKILIIGTGYVGLATGIAFAKKGNKVFFYDKVKQKIKLLGSGRLFFYEPQIQSALIELLNTPSISFHYDIREIPKDVDAIFICVGTPILRNGSTNLNAMISALHEIEKNFIANTTIVIKSTINPKDYAEIQKNISLERFHLAVNPEFLSEGNALEDTLKPARIVIGTNDEYAKNVLEKLYDSFDAPKIFTDPLSAIIIKYASNSFLAVKISFINEIANLSEKIGASIDDIALGIGLDPRIGREFLKAGIGFGGSCLPKDTKNISKYAKELGQELRIIEAAYKINERQYKIVIEKLNKHLGSLNSRKIAIFGLSFKGNTDDLRNSVSLKIISELQKEGAVLKLHDYKSFEKAKKIFRNLLISNDPYTVSKGTEAIIITTDWKDYQTLDWTRIKQLMSGNLVVDGRNILDKNILRSLGFWYEGIGRK